MNTLVNTIFQASDQIRNNRTPQDILNHLVSEIGELSTEISIEYGNSYKTPSVDGIVGESIDAILCLVDIIHKHAPELTEDDLAKYAQKKTVKWRKSVLLKEILDDHQHLSFSGKVLKTIEEIQEALLGKVVLDIMLYDNLYTAVEVYKPKENGEVFILAGDWTDNEMFRKFKSLK